MDASIGLSIPPASVAAAARLGLRQGETLSIRVDHSLGGGRYAVTIRGVVLVIRSQLALSPSQRLRARVVSVGARIELRLLPGGNARQAAGVKMPLPAAQGGVSSQEEGVLVQALRRTGLPITPAVVAAVSAMVPPARRREAGIVRFATLLYDKHLHVAPQELEELYLSVTGKEGDGGGGGTSHGGNPRGGGGSSGGGGSNGDEGFPRGGRGSAGQAGEQPRAVPGEAGASAPRSVVHGGVSPDTPGLREALRAQLTASEPERAGAGALFNHVRGEHGAWIIVPFSLTGGATRVDGSLRLLLDPGALPSSGPSSHLAVSRAVVAVEEVGYFEITGSPPRHLTLFAASAAMQRRLGELLPELTEKLRNLGVEVDDTINGDQICDGFSSETFPTGGVDATA